MTTDDSLKGSKSILLVEDQKQIAKVIGRMLESGGYAHHHAENGQAAIELLKKGLEPDLILLDIVMPVMDGYELLDELQGDTGLRHIPTVMLSAREDATSVMKAMKMGAVQYCTKPIHADELLQTIAKYV
jgi:CheY-like chemotaxis protein